MTGSPSHRDTFAEAIEQERERLALIEREQGSAEARAFAERIRNAYRRAVISRSPPAGDPVFRLRLMGSYCAFKRHLAQSAHRETPG